MLSKLNLCQTIFKKWMQKHDSRPIISRSYSLCCLIMCLIVLQNIKQEEVFTSHLETKGNNQKFNLLATFFHIKNLQHRDQHISLSNRFCMTAEKCSNRKESEGGQLAVCLKLHKTFQVPITQNLLWTFHTSQSSVQCCKKQVQG